MQTYTYTDYQKTAATVRYYRLKQTDLDGTFAYSPVRAVETAEVLAPVVYPNPFSSFCTIRVHAENAGVEELEITDLSGRVVFK
ncbi:MAG: T9SS type A sorting domain-containing protein, partial [Hymenobacteraceae bacterium]|nr:T9SS type A sorting domain-containing protein [Hymenobacteraceae bacterium]MDX5397676.1 T9SS type A sorting domain-containing protein [Hymenobacteraceae bacterium]MDX5513752.1 T9SS type A sorting domain-containing protein [Hymenobacteraceae bacterium]